jgi:peptidoglycan hydrolase CwlO-like protein
MAKIARFWIYALIIALFASIVWAVHNPPTPVLAAHQGQQTPDEIEKQLQDTQNQINQLTDQLNTAKSQENTLKGELTYIDNQNKLTQLKIQETQFQIKKLNSEILDLNGRIDRLSGSVDKLSNLLLNRIVTTYKYGQIDNLDLIFSANGFSDLLERLKYVQIIQENDKRVLYQLQATKSTYNDQKTDREKREAQQQKLQKDLSTYQQQLADQKQAKTELLRTTQNNEANYQKLISRLREDADSLTRALGGQGVKLGAVKKGDRVAGVGSSGCSTGPHLHFEVMTPAHVENNHIVGSENKVDPKPYLDSGKFTKVLSNYSGNDACSNGGSCNDGDISTRFHQWYSVLGGSYHTGLDIIDPWGTPIYASDDGDAYAFSDSKPCSLTKTVGKGVAIDHHNGIVTLYWHIP